MYHVLDSERDSFPQEIEFLFSGAQVGKVFGGSNGADLLFAQEAILSRDLGEYGRLDRFCVSDDFCFSKAVGSVLVSVLLVGSMVEDAIIGVSLSFSNGGILSVLNLGDEFFVYDHIPDNIRVSERLVFLPVSE